MAYANQTINYQQLGNIAQAREYFLGIWDYNFLQSITNDYSSGSIVLVSP
jgi:hypothetical protein